MSSGDSFGRVPSMTYESLESYAPEYVLLIVIASAAKQTHPCNDTPTAFVDTFNEMNP
jgi:hypothetical protein